MKMMVVDDEMIALRGMVRILGKMYPDAHVLTASTADEALLLFDDEIDVAFLDMELPEMNGLELGKELIERKSTLNIIYVTAYSQYALEAYQIHASGYLTKPVDIEQLRKEMDNLRYPVAEDNTRLVVRCFGNFEVFLNGEPAHFARRRAREVLAYLVDRRGAAVTLEELCETFWDSNSDPDKNKTSLQAMIKSLRKTLTENGMEDVLICRRNSYAVNTARLDCDYYRYLEGNEPAGDLFVGEYMVQYPWAKRTLEQIITKKKNDQIRQENI